MNYNYPQPQYQTSQYAGYGGYKPAPQYSQWGQTSSILPLVRPVSSIEEVKAYPIDFDGSIFYFADVANKRIYTKQINMDGTANINLYELKNLTQTDQTTTSFITREEFEIAINQLKEMCNKPILVPAAPVEHIQDVEQSAAQPKTQFIF